ncbi:MAG: hypothetical protein P4L33_00050 [Capsulimonadaceae bacterium]|nr:hypothetical protein [Capsulimonadaceae bacterium]
MNSRYAFAAIIVLLLVLGAVTHVLGAAFGAIRILARLAVVVGVVLYVIGLVRGRLSGNGTHSK